MTVGMGVDSNVLIFERIREELRNGRRRRRLWNRALPCLDHDRGHARHHDCLGGHSVPFGTGPVKGFAVTLGFGLFANLFTAVFVSRSIFDWLLSRKQRGEALSIG